MKRRDFLRLAGAGTLASFIPAAAESAESGKKPNIIFILADDLGWRDLSTTGSTFYETPNVERLRQRGMYFTDAYSANPLCSPTRASILTGLWPARIGITAPVCHVKEETFEASVKDKAPPTKKAITCESATRLKHEYLTVAEMLKENGYATAHFGKWHLGPEPYDPLYQGFDVDIPHWPGPGPAGSYVAPWKFKDFKERTPGEHLEDRMGDEAIKFIEENKDKPFYMNYWQFSVHAPFDAKKELIEKYKAKVDPNNPQKCPTYAAMVQSLDDNVGKVLSAVDRLGIADHTIIVFFSDNGGNMYNTVEDVPPTSNAPLRGGKATIYEGGTRVPCFVVWPGVVKPGSTSNQVIQSIDWYPTILEMLGIVRKPGQEFDGISIVPTLKGEKLSRDTIFCLFPHEPKVPEGTPPSVYVRKGGWKLIRIFFDGENQQHRYELYNLKDDIGEKNNLAEKYPERVTKMDALIEKFLLESKAVLPVKNPAYRPDAIDSADGWKEGGNGHATISLKNNNLVVKVSGNDPQLVTVGDLQTPKGPFIFEIKMQSKGEGNGVVFCAGPGKKIVPGSGVSFGIHHDGKWHEYRVELPQKNVAGLLRMDTGTGPGEYAIEWMKLKNSSGEVIREWMFPDRRTK
ncbi:MAG: hypothetical protein A2283_08735 [Lentisphaerae bacterium RIFOXYA12_FULL_48_11]|nr:MAG: hypothetical protein A2283_08735 [Lentisphaerae bacterium RIFOXYA12_FULL_48_11]